MAVSYTSSVAGVLAIAPACGLPAKNFAPLSFEAQAQVCATNANPPGSPTDFVIVCTGSLLARGIVYFKNVPGDCGTPTTIEPDQSTSEVNAAGQLAAGVASMAGAALPGIGSFINAITSIFGAAHAKAVATEQSTICSVAGVINQVFSYYDAQVKKGNISPSVAYTGMQAYLAQVIAQLQAIQKKCDAACFYIGVLKAHASFVQSYYPAIAPKGIFSILTVGGAPTEPPALPVGVGGTLVPGGAGAPGGVIATGAGVSTNLGGAIASKVPVFLSALNAPASKLGFSGTELGLIVLVLIALFAIGLAVL
jgi:hypothetical protein